ncbi:MAG: hypothetical protein ABIJ08_01405 [Nanoarchaeota archaeon]
MTNTSIPDCCEDCIKWEQFGKNCWVYWELKKNCTQKMTDSSQNQIL